MNQPMLGVSREDPGKYILGTVPVEDDGSAYFRVPSGVPVFFQALDEDGLALQTMRSLTYVQPGQTLACIGCHESRDAAPPPGGFQLATRRPPSKLKPGPSGTWPLRFDALVQPVLDQRCVSCHQSTSRVPEATAFDLTPPHAYDSLMNYADDDLRKLVFERDKSVVGDCPARKSKLLELLSHDDGHHDVHLEADDLARLVAWMDTYAQRLGSYSERQEEQLRSLRRDLNALLEEADKGAMNE